MRILFLSKWFPYPADNGSKLRIWSLLRGLATQHEVTLVTFADRDTGDLRTTELAAICRGVRVVPWKAYDANSVKARLGFLRAIPRSYIDTYSMQMKSAIEQEIDSRDFDIVIASEWEMASYASSFRDKAALFEDVELGVLYGRYAESETTIHKFRNGLTWHKHRNYLLRLLNDFDAFTVPSQIERELFAKAAPKYDKVTVIPNCIDLKDYQSVDATPERNSLIFTGSFRYAVNYDAMVWFLQNVYPLIQYEVPDVKLTITGDPANMVLPPASGVIQTGFVPEVLPFIASSWVSIVPLLSGGGTRLKILEAMALGTPVVTTTKGAEGLNVVDGQTVLVADEPEAFATAVVRLLQDGGLRERLAENAYQLVSEYYDWTGVMPSFLQLVEETARHSVANL